MCPNVLLLKIVIQLPLAINQVPLDVGVVVLFAIFSNKFGTHAHMNVVVMHECILCFRMCAQATNVGRIVCV